MHEVLTYSKHMSSYGFVMLIMKSLKEEKEMKESISGLVVRNNEQIFCTEVVPVQKKSTPEVPTALIRCIEDGMLVFIPEATYELKLSQGTDIRRFPVIRGG